MQSSVHPQVLNLQYNLALFMACICALLHRVTVDWACDGTGLATV